jgi:hypothetical protein
MYRMKCEDLIPLYSRLGFVLGIMVIALPLIVEHSAAPVSSHIKSSNTISSQYPSKIKTAQAISQNSNSDRRPFVKQFDLLATKARFDSTGMTIRKL